MANALGKIIIDMLANAIRVTQQLKIKKVAEKIHVESVKMELVKDLNSQLPVNVTKASEKVKDDVEEFETHAKANVEMVNAVVKVHLVTGVDATEAMLPSIGGDFV